MKLKSKTIQLANHLFQYSEHYQKQLTETESGLLSEAVYKRKFPICSANVQEQFCFHLNRHSIESVLYNLETSYFIGVDWIEKEKTALYIEPKLNTGSKETDFIRMLFSCIDQPEVSEQINNLFVIKWDEPTIEIEQKQDLLTPFLVVQFLGILKTIVRKGLKKSYYKVEQNLNSRVKGKVLVSKTIKHNLVQNKQLQTWCTYEEFGVNNIENRLLHKALVFVKRYLPGYTHQLDIGQLQNTFNYISPAFAMVSDEIGMNEIKQIKTNVFYKEYAPALRLAKLILRRFGYNISNTNKLKIETPPFWIDMSKLFELYVLGLLKKRFQNQVKYHFTTWGNELDYLLKSDDYKMVIDAKYIPGWTKGINHENVRQVSGYARLKEVYNELDIEYSKSIDCLIIYPDDSGVEDFQDVEIKQQKIKEYCGFYKLGVKIPVIS